MTPKNVKPIHNSTRKQTQTHLPVPEIEKQNKEWQKADAVIDIPIRTSFIEFLLALINITVIEAAAAFQLFQK